MSRKVTLKHGKKKHKGFEICEGESFEDFQAKVFSVTLVPIPRQKLICKGANITDDASLASIKAKSTLTLIGTAEAVETATPETAVAVFIEDMSEAEMHRTAAVLPVGLHNLGNTCYLNSTLQCLAGIPEFRDSLKTFALSRDPSAGPTVAAELGSLFTDMSTTTDAVVPRSFVNLFRGVFPRFAEQSERGGFAQQDADECLTELMASIRADVGTGGSSSSSTSSMVDDVFQGEFETTTTLSPDDPALVEMVGGSYTKDGSSGSASAAKTAASAASAVSEEVLTAIEPAEQNFEEFIKLRCFMDASTRHIRDGVAKDCLQTFEKTSETLGRMAKYQRRRRISKLPKYLTVQIVRFFWKASKQTNSKVLRAVEFPHEWDVFEFCGDSLKSRISKFRDAKETIEEYNRNGTIVSKEDDSKASGAGDGAASSTVATDADGDVDMAEEKKEDPSLLPTLTEDMQSGFYELVGLITHKGLSASSGHYIGYAKHEKHGWVKFDDDVVSTATPEDIQKLYGGGQWQMGYICFYRRKECVLPEVTGPSQ